MDVSSLEALLRWSNPTVEKERAALAAGRWIEYLEERVPPPSWLHPRERSAWSQARERALEIPTGTETLEALVFPIWFCSNEDDVPRADWEPAIAIAIGDEHPEVRERKTIGEIALVKLERLHLGYLVRSRDYAPDIALHYRNAHFGAFAGARIERVVEISATLASEEAPRPERLVPPFSIEAAPARVLTAPVDPAAADRIAKAIARLKVHPDGPETLVAPLRR